MDVFLKNMHQNIKYNYKIYMKRKNNYIIIILFIILITFIFIIFFIDKREGFTSIDTSIGEYQYLAPIPQYNTWSDSTIDKFIPIYKEATNSLEDINKDYVAKYFFMYALEDEAKYYISNSKWPLCPYIINYCNNEPTTINKVGLDASGNPITLEDFQKSMPNRYIYMVLILAIQQKLDPKPDACLIYLGEKEPPTYGMTYGVINNIKKFL